MAYVTTNPPARMDAGSLTGAGQVWYYSSADVDDTVIAANYITDALHLGMKVGDIVFIWDTAGKLSVAGVTAVTSSGSTMAFAAVA